LRREAHGGFGERPGETGQRQRWNRAPGRLSEELAASGIAAHLAEPADTAALPGRKRHAKTDRTDAAHLRQLLAEGRLPECWIPPGSYIPAAPSCPRQALRARPVPGFYRRGQLRRARCVGRSHCAGT
jgi:hypothetical protein